MNSEDLRRYSRQIAISDIGEVGQAALMRSHVMVVGCGALGSMVAIQLAGSGIGYLKIADFDTIDISNLQRQFFYKTSEAGFPKADVLAERIADLNPDCHVENIRSIVNKKIAEDLFGDCDFIIDATDNPDSKNAVEQVCDALGKPCCIAGVSEFHGQIMTILPGSMKFSELFPNEEESGFMPCSLSGVIGPAAALCASVQSSEAIKHITGAGCTLAGKLLTFNLLTNTFKLFDL